MAILFTLVVIAAINQNESIQWLLFNVPLLGLIPYLKVRQASYHIQEAINTHK